MKIKFITLILITFIVTIKTNRADAQNENMKWAVGLGWNAIDDNGSSSPSFNNLMIVPFPSTIHGARYLGYGLSLDASLCYNKYVNGKLVNGVETSYITNSNSFCYSFDLIAKYDLQVFYHLVSGTDAKTDNVNKGFNMVWNYLDPYVLFGYGYSYRAYYTIINRPAGCPTNDFGGGFNVWIKPFIGLNFQGVAKFRMKNGASNYVQYSMGVIYRFPKTAPTAIIKSDMTF